MIIWSYFPVKREFDKLSFVTRDCEVIFHYFHDSGKWNLDTHDPWFVMWTMQANPPEQVYLMDMYKYGIVPTDHFRALYGEPEPYLTRV